jgi:uncharacterized YigZ family protein
LEPYSIPGGEARADIVVLNSRFIASAAPALSVDQAREFIAHVRREYPDATHHVSAFLVGHGSTVVAHCNDDGEPSGTAGRPALAILQGSGLGDIVVVVIRYFGGTKLGTGGLVRAYGDAVRAVLEVLPRARKLLTHSVVITTAYPDFERTRLAIATHGGTIVSTDFGAEARITARFAVDDYPLFEDALQDLSCGTASTEIMETVVASVPL